MSEEEMKDITVTTEDLVNSISRLFLEKFEEQEGFHARDTLAAMAVHACMVFAASTMISMDISEEEGQRHLANTFKKVRPFVDNAIKMHSH